MSLLRRLLRLSVAASEAGQSGPEASDRASQAHRSATDAYRAGDDPLPHLRKRAARSLKRYQRQGLKKVEITAAKDSCDACKEQEGRVLTVQQALREMPVPCTDCTRPLGKRDERGFCRCDYLPVTGLSGSGSGEVKSRPLPG